MWEDPAVDAANRDPEVVERRTVGAAAGGREQADGGVLVLLETAVIVEVLQRARVRAVVDRRPERDGVGLADDARDLLAVALLVDVGIVDGKVVLAEVEQRRLRTGFLGRTEDVPQRRPRVTFLAEAATDGDHVRD